MHTKAKIFLFINENSPGIDGGLFGIMHLGNRISQMAMTRIDCSHRFLKTMSRLSSQGWHLFCFCCQTTVLFSSEALHLFYVYMLLLSNLTWNKTNWYTSDSHFNYLNCTLAQIVAVCNWIISSQIIVHIKVKNTLAAKHTVDF